MTKLYGDIITFECMNNVMLSRLKRVPQKWDQALKFSQRTACYTDIYLIEEERKWLCDKNVLSLASFSKIEQIPKPNKG